MRKYNERSRAGRTSLSTLREQVVYGEIPWATPSAGKPCADTGEGTTFLNSDGAPAEPGEKCYRADNGRMVQTHIELQARQWSTPGVSRGDYTRTDGDPDKPRPKLSGEVKNWSTPQQDDSNNGTRESGTFNSLTRDVRAWPTPVAHDAECSGFTPDGKRGEQLNHQAKSWPSPQARDFRSVTGREDHQRDNADQNLNVVAVKWGTPRASDGKGTGEFGGKTHANDTEKQYLRAEVIVAAGEQLNPEWEEILMGWPIGWTNPAQPCAGIWPGWPMGQGPDQFAYEPPRTIPKGTMLLRTKRVEICGNGVCPQQAAAAFTLLLSEACA